MLNEYRDILDIKEVAEILRIGINTAYKLVKDGTIPSRRVGRKYLIPKICLIDYIKSTMYTSN